MSSNAMSGKKSRVRKKKTDRRRDANAGEAIPGLSNHLVATLILRSDFFDDHAELARLRPVSRAMRAAVSSTRRCLEEMDATAAMKAGCFSAMQRLQRRGLLSPHTLSFLCPTAARAELVQELKLLRENDSPWDEWTCCGAAADGHVHLLEWAHANGCSCGVHTSHSAASEGQLESLMWLHANGCPWDEENCAQAAAGGHLESLKWLRKNDYSWGVRTCAFLAKKGDLEVLQWARANGCPWNKQTCSFAAEAGHLEIIKWARANGAPWDSDTCRQASGEGHFEVLKWLFQHGCPVNEESCAQAAGDDNLELLKWLRKNGATWDECTFILAHTQRRRKVLTWAIANGVPKPAAVQIAESMGADVSIDMLFEMLP